MQRKDLYTVFTNSGAKEIKNSNELNQLLQTDTIQFYTTGNRADDFNWNSLLKRWEYNKIF